MQVILLEDVLSLGKAGDLVKVSDGYGRNYLIPQKKAILATEKSLKVIEHPKRQVQLINLAIQLLLKWIDKRNSEGHDGESTAARWRETFLADQI